MISASLFELPDHYLIIACFIGNDQVMIRQFPWGGNDKPQAGLGDNSRNTISLEF